MPEPYRMDAKAYIERPFFVTNLTFSSTLTRYSVVPNLIARLPGDIIRSNVSLLNAMKIASLYRADLMLNISIAGTIAHAGCVLVGVIPPVPWPINSNSHQNLINTLLSGPHAFLFANEATTVNLAVPWYCNTDMATLDMEISDTYKPSLDIVPTNGNYATLIMLVLNPLSVASGGSTDIPIVVEACFKGLDLAVPTPRYVTWQSQSLFGGIMNGITGLGTRLLDQTASGLKQVSGDAIDGARQYIRGWTGLHNPNDSKIMGRVITTERNFANVVDSAQYFEKLDPNTTYDRIVKQPIFGTDIDEESITHITSKPQFIGSFKASTSDVVGKLLWCRPISPYQGGTAAQKPIIANNIELLHFISRAWRGGLKLHIQSVMNNKQQCKLRVLKMYNPSLSALTGYPQYASIVNAPSHLLEFTQGGQEQIVSLPYLCRNDLTPCSRELSFEALYHGMYYIYIAQPLVVADGSPTEVEFNVYISGDEDLTFYGYATEIGAIQGFSDFKPATSEANVVMSVEMKKMYERASVSVGKALIEDREVKTVKGSTILERNVVGTSRFKKPEKTFIQPSIRSVTSKKDLETIYNKNVKFNEKLKVTKANSYEAGGDYYVPELEDEQEVEFEEDSEVVNEEAGYESQSFFTGSQITLDDIHSMQDSTTYKKVNKRKKKRKNFSCACSYESQSLEVMNEPQKQTDKDMKVDKIVDFNHIDRLKPNYSMRDYVRRMYKVIGSAIEVEANGSVKLDIPLSSIAGEDNINNALTASPLTFISNMYYGKTLGFKFKVKTTVLGTLTKAPNYIVQMYYLPPNMHFDTASHTIMGSMTTSLPIDADPYQSTPSVFPLPLQLTPVQANEVDGSFTYEFVIPDVTYYKFMGSPNKLVTLDTPTSYLSTMNFGNLLIQVLNAAADNVNVGIQVFAGYTDESRLGFHSIAPLISTFTWKPEPTDSDSIQTLYLGNPTTPTKPPVAAINTFIYKGGLL